MLETQHGSATEAGVTQSTSPMENTQRDAQSSSGGSSRLSCCSAFAGLKSAPTELWCVFGLMVLESYAYFSVAVNLPVHLTNHFGFSDKQAGLVYGVFGFGISFLGILSGIVIDSLGVKHALCFGAVVSGLGRFLLAFASRRWVVLVSCMAVMPLGMGFGLPVLVIAVKRFTTVGNRPFAFSFFYACQNLAIIAVGPVTDLCRHRLSNGVNIANRHFSPLQVVFFTSVLTSVLQGVIAMCILRHIEIDNSGEVVAFQPRRARSCQFLKRMVRDKRFWRLVVYTCLVIGVRLVYRHLDATFPKYLTRELGAKASYGLLYSLHPVVVLLAVPLIGAYTTNVHPFTMTLYGSVVAAGSAFVLCVGASYPSAIVFVVLLSIGEAIYSPAVFEFNMLVAPKGREGIYAGLAHAPMFVAKLIAGWMSGELLHAFCPESGDRDCWKVWAVVGGVALSSPLLMLLLRGFIYPEHASNSRAYERHLDDDDSLGGAHNIELASVAPSMVPNAAPKE